MPRIGFSFVDVRDVADLQIRAMTAPEAGGERFIAVGEFLWMSEVAEVLRERLGADAAEGADAHGAQPPGAGDGAASTPASARSSASSARSVDYSSEKAEARLGWSPRPVEETIVDCARSMIG